MNKIDEYKEIFKGQTIECACGDIYFATYNSIIQNALEQLRPYVELGETIAEHSKKLLNGEFPYIELLINQIKEQEG